MKDAYTELKQEQCNDGIYPQTFYNPFPLMLKGGEVLEEVLPSMPKGETVWNIVIDGKVAALESLFKAKE